MGDDNPIRTLGDYSRPSHEGYRNTIKLPKGNNVVPLRSNTIRLVQNGCSFHGLRSEDPNQHLKDFLKLMDSLDLDGENRERTRLQSLSKAWTHFKVLLQKVPHHGIDRWLQCQIFYDHVSFHLKCEIDRATGDKLRNKNADESWEIIENLALYDRKGPSPQPQALNTTFEARVREYMAAHTERMERFKNTIFKQHEEINGRMTEMFGLLKELTTSKTPEKVLIREKAKFPITKNLNSISLTKGEEEESNRTKVTPGNAEKPTETETEMPVMEVEKINEVENGTKLIKTSKNEEAVDAPGIAEDVLVKITEHVYPVDFVILDIKENKNRPFILGTPFLTTAKASIKFNTGTITLRSGKHKASPRMGRKDKTPLKKGNVVYRWRSKNFKGMHPTLIKTKEEEDDEGEVT
ncbi:MAK10-like protein [Tanacetum coccineum]